MIVGEGCGCMWKDQADLEARGHRCCRRGGALSAGDVMLLIVLLGILLLVVLALR